MTDVSEQELFIILLVINRCTVWYKNITNFTAYHKSDFENEVFLLRVNTSGISLVTKNLLSIKISAPGCVVQIKNSIFVQCSSNIHEQTGTRRIQGQRSNNLGGTATSFYMMECAK